MKFIKNLHLLLDKIKCKGGLPFQMQLPKPNPETIAAIEDVNNNRNMSCTFDSVDELMKDLNEK
ncbi:MAG: hypothetical protein FJW63_04050 [Actinobacteria bacterium]|nr:hypothetical protein [Actinomycetota bacterium]